MANFYKRTGLSQTDDRTEILQVKFAQNFEDIFGSEVPLDSTRTGTSFKSQFTATSAETETISLGLYIDEVYT